MSKIYIIQYSVKNDSSIIERIKSFGSWMNYFPDSWIIETDQSSEDIYNIISEGYEKDRILIMKLEKQDYWGVLPEDAWQWIKSK